MTLALVFLNNNDLINGYKPQLLAFEFRQNWKRLSFKTKKVQNNTQPCKTCSGWEKNINSLKHSINSDHRISYDSTSNLTPINPAHRTGELYFFLHNLLQSVCVQISTMMYFKWTKASGNYLFPGKVTTVQPPGTVCDKVKLSPDWRRQTSVSSSLCLTNTASSQLGLFRGISCSSPGGNGAEWRDPERGHNSEP